MTFETKARAEINSYMDETGIEIPDLIINYYLAARQCDKKEIKLAFIKSIEALGDDRVNPKNPAHNSLIEASYLASQAEEMKINVVDFMASFREEPNWHGFFSQLRNETGSEENQARATVAANLLKSAQGAAQDMSRKDYNAVARVAKRFPIVPDKMRSS